jgi:hypothetical protein
LVVGAFAFDLDISFDADNVQRESE